VVGHKNLANTLKALHYPLVMSGIWHKGKCERGAEIINDIIAGSFAIRQSKTILARAGFVDEIGRYVD
jgi:hypothetical protein